MSRDDPKILILGHGGHGKDLAASMLFNLHGLTHCSSSRFALGRAVWPMVKHLYVSMDAAYEDRRNHRELWFHAIAAYNRVPGNDLARELLEEFNIYTGMRSRAEFEKSRFLFDLVLWVHAEGRPTEGQGSMELNPRDADVIVSNVWGDPGVMSLQLARLDIATKENNEEIKG